MKRTNAKAANTAIDASMIGLLSVIIDLKIIFDTNIFLNLTETYSGLKSRKEAQTMCILKDFAFTARVND